MNASLIKNKKYFAISIPIVIIPFIVLAIVFGLYDLQISHVFVNQNSNWGIFGAKYGELPGYAIIFIGLAILIGSFIKNVIYQKIPTFILSILAIIGLLTYGILSVDYNLIIATIFSFGIVIIFSIATIKIDWKSLRKFAYITLLLTLINPLFLVQLLKFLCGRVRYRDLDSGFTNYTPWFLPPGPSSSHSSFPSGHTAMGWMLLPLLLVFKMQNRKILLEIITTILVSTWGIFVGLSRIKVGAHYASDVLFSTMFAFLFMIIFYYLFFIRSKQKEDEIKQEENDLSMKAN